MLWINKWEHNQRRKTLNKEHNPQELKTEYSSKNNIYIYIYKKCYQFNLLNSDVINLDRSSKNGDYQSTWFNGFSLYFQWVLII
jgi:hypothetical protein